MSNLKLVSVNETIEIKQCQNCAWYKYNKPFSGGFVPMPINPFHIFHTCTNPSLLPIDPVRGSASAVDCDYVRKGIEYPYSSKTHQELKGKCGVRGIYFEKHKPTFWQRLWGKK